MSLHCCARRNPNAASTSPKLRLKLQRFWGGGHANGNGHGPSAPTPNGSGAPTPSSASLPSTPSKPGRGGPVVAAGNPVGSSSTGMALAEDAGVGSWGAAGAAVMAASVASDADGRRRGAAFAHYDVQSITANLSYAARLRGLLLARRRNTTTGASAASMLSAGPRSTTPDAASPAAGSNGGVDSGDEDSGDGNANHLLDSCPFFRNEVGGEGERVVSLTRCLPAGAAPATGGAPPSPLHRPTLACGVSVLEFPPGETHWKAGISCCPYQRPPPHAAVESVDQGALYYRRFFHGQGMAVCKKSTA